MADAPLRDPSARSATGGAALIVVIGAGPTGLGAAWRLTERRREDWLLIESAPQAGGLAGSVVDPAGFTWDLGGHVLFSHYDYFDALMDSLLGDSWVEHVRESWIWMRERFIPYPLQNNIWRLPKDDLWQCLQGLLKRSSSTSCAVDDGFHAWIHAQFGVGLADVFMLPYNRKVWATEPADMGSGWVGERVATVDFERVLRNVVYQQDDCSWGPNARFRFPLRGGTGAIWTACSAQLAASRVRYGTEVRTIDPDRRVVVTAEGEEIAYSRVLSTMPLDQLLRSIEGRPDLAALAPRLRSCSTNLVGVGLQGQPPDALRSKNWMYFPEEALPFYRVTVFSNYSPNNVPLPGQQWSLLCECSESDAFPVDVDGLAERTVRALREIGFIAPQTAVASIWRTRLERGYPVPFRGRDDLLGPIDAGLREMGIYSRGRFGAWKYEVSNQDHSLMQGVEAIDHFLDGTPELTYAEPGVVNSQRTR